MGFAVEKADMSFIVSGPLPLITDMLFPKTGHNWPVDRLAGSPEDGINSKDGSCGPFAVPGLPSLPILFALCQWEAGPGTPMGQTFLALLSFCTSFFKAKVSQHTSPLTFKQRSVGKARGKNHLSYT